MTIGVKVCARNKDTLRQRFGAGRACRGVLRFARIAGKRLSVASALALAVTVAPLAAPQLSDQSAQASPRGQQSAIVIDARTGRTLYGVAPDAPCYPASLTKVMTLYMVFTELEAGRLQLNTPLHVSREAASREPSKLYLKPGSSIQVEDAILALVTKSANDVAAVIGENIAGSELNFGREMTTTAHSIGMTNTTFRNASGLPDRKQVTTARDMAILAKRVQEDFPQYFHYFSATRFVWGDRVIGNHNHLLRDYQGTTGLKTGYTRASGYNLTATVERNGRELIGVVIGGSSSRARNAEMIRILDRAMDKAAPARTVATRLGPVAVPVGTSVRTFAQGIGQPRATRYAAATPTPADRPDPRSTLRQLAALQQTNGSTRAVESKPAAAPQPPAAPVASAASGIAQPGETETHHPQSSSATSVNNGAETAGPTKPVATRKHQSAPAPETPALDTPALDTVVANALNTGPAAKPAHLVATDLVVSREAAARRFPADSWIIQIGAFSAPDGAASRLQEARKFAPAALQGAIPVAVPVKAGDKTLYRARFGGFQSEASAKSACGQLTQISISCITIPPSSWDVPRRTASLD